MTPELTALAWTVVLAIVQIFLAAAATTRQYGLKWNAGARDRQQPPLNPVAGRLVRAQQNLFETLPLFAALVLIAVVANRTSELTALGAWLYLGARVVYLPLYAAGIPYLRSLAWLAGLVGLLTILWQVLVA